MNTPEDLIKHGDPDEFAALSELQNTVGAEMISRLDWMTLKPVRIVEVGCKVGAVTTLLHERYPEAEIQAYDDSLAMLEFARKKNLSRVTWAEASADMLPLKSHSVDLLLANLALPWCTDFKKVFEEWRRVLRPEGLLMFTSLGPDTLRELQSFPLQLPHLMDMHNIGDCLAEVGFLDPVMDVDYFTLSYRTEMQLFHELKITGMLAGDVSQITLKPDAEERFPVTYEIVFGHAFGAGAKSGFSADESGEVRIPISHLLRR